MVSPDGKQVAFIGGLMSDFDAVSGDAFVMPLDDPHAVARDVTAGWTVSVVSLGWGCRDGTLRAGLQAGSETQMVTLADTPVRRAALDRLFGRGAVAGRRRIRFRGLQARHGRDDPSGLRPAPRNRRRPDRTDGATSPALNDGVMAPAAAKTLPIAWKHDGFDEQGWLLLPKQTPPQAGLPMITIVHGGPGAAYMPNFIGPGLQRDMLAAGYAVFLPNPRGSFGQG